MHPKAPESPVTDPKKGEREYFARIEAAGREHAARKPFSDAGCAEYLLKTSAYLMLMPLPPARVIEFGCGSGWLSLIFAERGYDVVAVDIAPEAIAIAERLRSERGLPNVSFRVADYEDLKIEPPADIAIFHDSLHHAESESAALRAAYVSLKPGGMAICMEPGAGHSGLPASLQAVRDYGVHEKDMPPGCIVRLAYAAGFSRHLVLPWPHQIMRSFFHPSVPKAPNSRSAGIRVVHGIWRCIRSCFQARKHGVVVLWRA